MTFVGSEAMNEPLPFTRTEIGVAVGSTAVVVLAALALGRGQYMGATGALFFMVLGFLNIAQARTSVARGQPAVGRIRDWLSVVAFGGAAVTLLLASQL